MRAAVLHRPLPVEQNPLRLEDVPEPIVGLRQVLVKISACGVCRSTLHMVEGDWVKHGAPAKLPIIPGHEIVGRVATVGEHVTEFTIDEKVGIQPLWFSCGNCEFCLTGREEICPSRQITGSNVDGGYAEYILANVDHLYRVPKELEDSVAAPLFCAGITAYGAVLRARLSPGKKVAVFGVGGVGHMVIQIARLFGAEVVAVSRNSHHLRLADELGSSLQVDASKTDPAEEIKRIGGVDSSIVFAPSDSFARKALESTNPGGTVVLGVYADLGEIPFDEQKTIVCYTSGSRQEMREVLNLASAGKIGIVSEEFELAQVNVVLKRLKDGGIRARAVLVP